MRRMARVAVLPLPSVGCLTGRDIRLLFYDGGECVRNLDEHASAVKRPRGYSCEELGGLAYFLDGDLDCIHRLSQHFPLFVSPHGTGCSRYVDVLQTASEWIATWQQSQPDLSQPLVMNRVSNDSIERISLDLDGSIAWPEAPTGDATAIGAALEDVTRIGGGERMNTMSLLPAQEIRPWTFGIEGRSMSVAMAAIITITASRCGLRAAVCGAA